LKEKDKSDFLISFNFILVLLESFGITDVQGRAYYPQLRGLVERKNKTIKSKV